MGNSCTGITSVTLPEDLTSIGEEAFDRSWALTSVTFPEGLTSIGQWAFTYSGLTSVTFPKGLNSIGKEAFSDCSSLTSVTFPEGHTCSIAKGAFHGCKLNAASKAAIKKVQGSAVCIIS